jgi:PIN domain nuclease of toxin-antitoxin system
MRYLIDTNVFLFYCLEEELLSRQVLDILEDYGNLIFISAESIKEIVLLMEAGKIRTPKWRGVDDVLETISRIGMEIKTVDMGHIKAFARLVPPKDHRDPIDRLIIAQAVAERMTVISSDRKFEHYRRQGLGFIHNKR